MMVLIRLIQTSITSACEFEDPYGVGVAYIFPRCPCELCDTGDATKYMKHQSKCFFFYI